MYVCMYVRMYVCMYICINNILYRIMRKLFYECQDHIKDDHLLLRLLVYLSSEDDIEVTMNNAPVHIVALHVAKLWHIIDKVKKVTYALA